jgi:hypothetical protein
MAIENTTPQSRLETAERLVELLRREPYRLLANNCFTKSLRLKRLLREKGVPSRVVACVGLARARWFGRWLTIPVIHGWTEVEGKRIETSRPLGAPGIWGIIPVNIRPLVTIRF